MRFLTALLCVFFLSGCDLKKTKSVFQSIETVDEHGFSQTISDPNRLIFFSSEDPFQNMPYKKVTKIYKRDKAGSILTTISSYYPSGQIRQFLQTRDGRACGKYLEWFESGVQKIDANVVGGICDIGPGSESTWVFDEKCISWHNNGNIECEVSYVNGMKNGIAYTYFLNGKIKEKIEFKDNKIDGLKEVFNIHGECILIEKYQKGYQEGLSKGFCKGKLIFVEDFQNNLLINATYTSLDEKIISTIRNGNGKRIVFEEGKISQKQTYIDGKQKGAIEFFDKNGNILRIANYKDGLLHGEDIEFYKDKKKSKKSLINWNLGTIDGTVKTWYKNGQLESCHNRVSNNRDGNLTCYYPDGSIMMIEEYKEGKLIHGKYFCKNKSKHVSKVEDGNGCVTIFNCDGSVKHKIIYKHGLPFIKE